MLTAVALRVLLFELGGALDAASGVTLQRISRASVTNRLEILLALLGTTSFDFESGCVDAHLYSLLAIVTCKGFQIIINYSLSRGEEP